MIGIGQDETTLTFFFLFILSKDELGKDESRKDKTRKDEMGKDGTGVDPYINIIPITTISYLTSSSLEHRRDN